MMKKFMAGALTVTMLLGTAAALPQSSISESFAITASADTVSDLVEQAWSDGLNSSKPVTSGDWTYRVRPNGTLIVDSYNGKSKDIVIPEKIDGKTVTVLWTVDNAVSGANSLTMPDTVVFAYGVAFGTDTPKKIVLSRNLMYASESFLPADKTEEIVLPDNTDFNFFCLGWGSEKTKYTLPANAKNITMQDNAVYSKDKTKLLFITTKGTKPVTVPKTVTSFADNLYNLYAPSFIFEDGMTKLPTLPSYQSSGTEMVLVIPKSVKSIDKKWVCFHEEYYDKETGKDINRTAVCPGVTIKGYKGSYAETFAKKNGVKFVEIGAFSDCKVTIPYSSYTYRGRAIKPTVTVKDANGNKLTKGTDYTVSYKNNTDVGTATITVTGKGAYSGTLTKKFTVKPLDLTSSYAKVAMPYSAYTYVAGGVKAKPSVKFKDGSTIPTTAYSLSYSGNTKLGTAAVTIKGDGKNTTGSVKKTFIVKPEKNEIKTITGTAKGAFKISWNKATAGSVGYQVLYSRNKAALESAVGEVKNSNAAKYVHSYTSTNLSDLSESFSKVPNSGETWYVKVRSFYTKDGKPTSTRYGNYSDVKSIKVK